MNIEKSLLLLIYCVKQWLFFHKLKLTYNSYFLAFHLNEVQNNFSFFLKKSSLTQQEYLLDKTVVINSNNFEFIYSYFINLKKNLRFLCITCKENFNYKQYNKFLKLFLNTKIKIKFNKPHNFYSAFFLYESSKWLEQEIWDLFGITFTNHPNLKKILTDYGFKGHPLKKDFPSIGFTELYFNKKKNIISSLEFK